MVRANAPSVAFADSSPVSRWSKAHKIDFLHRVAGEVALSEAK